MPCSDARVPCRATAAKVARSSLDVTAPSATRRPAAEAETTAGDGVPAEPVEAAHEMAAPAPTTATGAAFAVGTAAAEPPVVTFVGEVPHGGALEVAPQESVVGGSAPPSSRRGPPATGERPTQPVGTGWDILASGSAVALNLPYDYLLARAHHAIDRLGGSLAAGLVELEAERQRLMAERAAHEAECRCLAAATERETPTAAAAVTAVRGEAESDTRLQAALDAERELALGERELSRTATEQHTERARLEQLEEVLVARQDAIDRRESKFHADVDARGVQPEGQGHPSPRAWRLHRKDEHFPVNNPSVVDV